MPLPKITYCPGTLKADCKTYSNTALRRVFNGRKVHHVLPYNSPVGDGAGKLFADSQELLSISGVQEKYPVALHKNVLRLTAEGDQSTYILKPIPSKGKRANQMPANEHLTMQIARQVFNIPTAENALIFFKDGAPAYLTKRFDVKSDGSKWAQEDFAAIAGRSPQTHGKDFKYRGNYLQLFTLLKQYAPAYALESLKLYRLVLFNYLIANGDAHFKNFSLIETAQGDFKLSPAYDLLNSRIHVEDSDFALKDGLLPAKYNKGKVSVHFQTLGKMAGIPEKQLVRTFDDLTAKDGDVLALIEASYLNDATKKNYRQTYQRRLNKMF